MKHVRKLLGHYTLSRAQLDLKNWPGIDHLFARRALQPPKVPKVRVVPSQSPCVSLNGNVDLGESILKVPDHSSRAQSSPLMPSERKSPRLSDERVINGKFPKKLLNVTLDGELDLEVKLCPSKGRTVHTLRPIAKGSPVVEYRGELISRKEAMRREKDYEVQADVGAFMFFFEWRNQRLCVDSSKEKTGFYGRLLNHSRRHANLRPRIVDSAGKPRIVFYALRDISCGEELLIDYGDRTSKSLESNPWLKH